jgi:protein-tyrosine phosphatase
LDSDLPFGIPYVSEIVPGLWQGGYKHGLVLPAFIKNLVCLYTEECYDLPPQVTRYAFDMKDSTEQTFEQVDGIASLVNRLRTDGPLLVHCQAGINRSALIVCRALMLEGMSADEAIALIREKRSMGCLSNPMFEEWLRSR